VSRIGKTIEKLKPGNAGSRHASTVISPSQGRRNALPTSTAVGQVMSGADRLKKRPLELARWGTVMYGDS